MEEKIEKLKKFLINNELEFSSGRRNSDCTIISGFALHLNITSVNEIINTIEETVVEAHDYEGELRRVFDYAKTNHYEDYWKTTLAKSEYVF